MRNKKGRISTLYFKNVILIFIFTNGDYEPARFKAFMELFDVFARPDRDRMPTRPYVEWKHYVDAAKQQLLNGGTLVEDGNGRFKIAAERADEVFKQTAGYLEAVAN
jgi:hypothetical protein